MMILKELFFKIIDFVDTIETLLFYKIELPITIEIFGQTISYIQVWSILGGAVFVILFALWLRKKVF